MRGHRLLDQQVVAVGITLVHGNHVRRSMAGETGQAHRVLQLRYRLAVGRVPDHVAGVVVARRAASAANGVVMDHAARR